MRVLVVSKPATPPPPEMFLGIMQAFKAWREKWRPKMEMFEFFAAGAGGWGVINASDEKELSQIMMEYPWQPFSNTEVLPTVDGDDALDRAIETIGQMMAAMRQG